jgi:hypothetical protein
MREQKNQAALVAKKSKDIEISSLITIAVMQRNGGLKTEPRFQDFLKRRVVNNRFLSGVLTGFFTSR